MSVELAVVIPYYKRKYFDETLKSFAAQTNKAFTVYIGDDCSPEAPVDIINKYSSQLKIVYKRFDSNLGGRDLVGQWKRCIDLTNGERWLWLFSDDDVVGSKCVESFYKTVTIAPVFDVYHFDVHVIDCEGSVIHKAKRFPDIISYDELFVRNGKGHLPSFVVEYVFSRDVYQEKAGFVSFPYAWGSDIATWCKFSRSKGVKTIQGDEVYWRSSDINITPDTSLTYEKTLAIIKCLKWYKDYFNSKKINKEIPRVFFYHLFFNSTHLTRFQISELLQKATEAEVLPKIWGSYLSRGRIIKILRELKNLLQRK